jgi:hypothetical protein
MAFFCDMVRPDQHIEPRRMPICREREASLSSLNMRLYRRKCSLRSRRHLARSTEIWMWSRILESGGRGRGVKSSLIGARN